MFLTTLRALLVFFFLVCLTHQGNSTSRGGNNYVRDACSVTKYPDICIHSLASYSNSAKRDHYKWARAAVSVTLADAKNVATYLSILKTGGHLRGRGRLALLDCIENFQDTIDNLHNSLGQLRRLNARTFNGQMGNVQTWMSAALTDQDTCLDGFNGRRGRQVRLLHNRVMNLSYKTSNALALVNKLASAGG